MYALMEPRNIGRVNATGDLYKVCPNFNDAIEVYKEKVREPNLIREELTSEGPVWWIDENDSGAAAVIRYTLHGPLEKVPNV